MLICIMTICLSIFGRDSHVKARALSHWWGQQLCGIGGIKVVVEGREKLPQAQSYIFAVNHQSQLDIPVLEGYVGRDFCWMAKKELFKIPIFGRAMLANGFIPVDRGHGRKAMVSLLEAAKRIAAGVSVVIFPEGTRSINGQLQPFKSGAMVVAIKAGVPLVPVAIIGTHAALAKGKLFVQPGQVTIRIGEPIQTKGCKFSDKQQLAELLREKVAALLVDL